MKDYRNELFQSSLGPTTSVPTNRAAARNTVLELTRISVFSALVAVGTLLSNLLFGITLPPPLGEITAAPAFYMAIAVLFSRKVSFWSTAIGSAIGESISIFVLGQVPAVFALTFLPGIVLARAPEVLIIYRFRDKLRGLLLGMGLATVYETVVFFLIDWPVYSFTEFYCSSPGCGSAGILQGFWLASLDFATLIDLVWIPVSLVLILVVQRVYQVQHFI